jgi:hypothetical protein
MPGLPKFTNEVQHLSGKVLPSDETRRLLKIFGIAMTNYEDAVIKGASAEELKKAEGEVRARLEEIAALIERLARRKSE